MNEERKFYVYLIRVDDVPRYVGKGTRDRVDQKTRSNAIVDEKLEAAEASGAKVTHEFLHVNLTESEAFELEKNEILQLGRECNRTGQLWNMRVGGGASTEAARKAVESLGHKRACTRARKGWETRVLAV